jgi:hypothetical protein
LLSSGDFTENTFSGGVDLIDSTLADVKSKLNYEYSERLGTYVQVGYAQLNPDGPFKNTDIARLALGADYQLTEALKTSFRVAQYHLSGRQTDTDWEAGMKMTYDIDRMGFSAELNREVTGAGGAGGFQKADTFRLGWLFDASEIDRFSASYSLVKFKEDNQVLLPKTEFEEINATYSRVLIGNWNAQANVSFREISSSGNRSDGTIIGVSLIYDALSF